MKLEMIEDGRPIWTHLCILHVFEIKACLDAIAEVREEERQFLANHEQSVPPGN